jgi:hypothetical protein
MKHAQPAALALVLLAGTAVKAEPITYAGYLFTNSHPQVTANDGSGASVDVSPLEGTVRKDGQYLAAMFLVNPPPSGTASFTDRPFTLTMHVGDSLGNTSSNLTFTGTLSGTVTREPSADNTIINSTSALTATFTRPTQSVALDGLIYTFSLSSKLSRYPNTPGMIMADVTVTPPITQAPEPGTLLLGLFGGSALGLRCWWRKRRPARGAEGRPGTA